MDIGKVHGISSERPAQELNDEELHFLWMQMVRERQPGEIETLLRGSRNKLSPSQERIVAVGDEMAKRNLFSWFCLSGPTLKEEELDYDAELQRQHA